MSHKKPHSPTEVTVESTVRIRMRSNESDYLDPTIHHMQRSQCLVNSRASHKNHPSAAKNMESVTPSPAFALPSPAMHVYSQSPIGHLSHRNITACSAKHHPNGAVSRRQFANLVFSASTLSVLHTLNNPAPVHAARPEGVNRPELLPNDQTTVIDLERFMATGEVRRLREKIDDVEKRTGFKIRLLTQRYPQTPGLGK